MELSKETIDEIFESAKDQYDYAIALYKIAFTDFEIINEIDGHPKVSKNTATYIFDKAIAFDKIHHPDVINGGLWLNKGFGSSEDMKDWTVDISSCKLIYEYEQQESETK